jgi:transposase-like protein
MSKRKEQDLSELRSSRAWTRAEGERVIEAWKASQQPVAEFAQRMGLHVGRVYRWRRRLGDEAAQARKADGAPAFLPVIVRGTWPAEEPSTRGAVMVLMREGVRVEVTELGAESAEWVARLVRALGEVTT